MKAAQGTLEDAEVTSSALATVESFVVEYGAYVPCMRCALGVPHDPADALTLQELMVEQAEDGPDTAVADDVAYLVGRCRFCRSALGRVWASFPPIERVTQQVPATVERVERDAEERIVRVVLRDERTVDELRGKVLGWYAEMQSAQWTLSRPRRHLPSVGPEAFEKDFAWPLDFTRWDATLHANPRRAEKSDDWRTPMATAAFVDLGRYRVVFGVRVGAIVK